MKNAKLMKRLCRNLHTRAVSVAFGVCCRCLNNRGDVRCDRKKLLEKLLKLLSEMFKVVKNSCWKILDVVEKCCEELKCCRKNVVEKTESC